MSAEGKQCEETCSLMNLICIPEIITNNLTTIFEKVGLNCSSVGQEQTSLSKWNNYYHPSYNVSSEQCVGFKEVPSRVECTVANFPLKDVRRLCNCQNASMYFVTALFYSWGHLLERLTGSDIFYVSFFELLSALG